jgi:hypothetical protein
MMDSFTVRESKSYELMDTMESTFCTIRHSFLDHDVFDHHLRLHEALRHLVNPVTSTTRLFPDWQFSDFVLENHHED